MIDSKPLSDEVVRLLFPGVKKSCWLFSWQFFRDLLWLQWCFCLFLSTWWWWGWRDGPQSSHPSHSSYLILSCPPVLNWVAAGKGVLENVTKTEIQMKEQLRKKMECVPNNTTWRKEREILFWWKKFLTWTRVVFELDYLKSFKVPPLCSSTFPATTHQTIHLWLLSYLILIPPIPSIHPSIHPLIGLIVPNCQKWPWQVSGR